MTRKEILNEADRCVNQDRNDIHGIPENSFGLIAALWTSYLGRPVSPVDVTALMSLLKIARIAKNPKHQDSWIDLAGYAACGGELGVEKVLPPDVDEPPKHYFIQDMGESLLKGNLVCTCGKINSDPCHLL